MCISLFLAVLFAYCVKQLETYAYILQCCLFQLNLLRFMNTIDENETDSGLDCLVNKII